MSRLVAVVVEEAELDPLGVLGEEREVRAVPVPRRAERERLAGPDLHSAASARTVFGVEVGDELDARRGARAGRGGARRRRSSTSRGSVAAQREQLAVERAQLRVARAGSSFECWNVASACGSGSPRCANAANVANSLRRPSRVASAMNGSTWSVKNWNGRVSPYSSPMKSSGVCGAKSDDRGGEPAHVGGQAVAERAVADLVVILRADHEPLPGRSRVGLSQGRRPYRSGS